jgi:hypothetical protein
MRQAQQLSVGGGEALQRSMDLLRESAPRAGKTRIKAQLTHNYDCPLRGHPAHLHPGTNGATTAPSVPSGERRQLSPR